MRRRIFEGATACIAANGYHRTSISQVAQQCGVSVGALQHHFPSKLDLMAATAEYLLSLALRWFSEAKEDFSRDPEAYEKALFRAWREVFKTREYAACLEILVAARTDSDLKMRIMPALADWRSSLDAELAALFPQEADRCGVEAGLTISRALMTGLLVKEDLMGDEESIDNALKAWVKVLKAG